MASQDESTQERLTSNSLVAMIGFSLFAVWMLFVCFWMPGFPDTPDGFAISALDRLGIFAGIPIGFAISSRLGRRSSFNLFDHKVLIIAAAIAVIVPSTCSAISSAYFGPLWVTFICFMVGGIAGSFIQVCWLDVLSRFDLSKLGLSIGASTAAGVVVFLLLVSMPWYAQDIAASVCVLTSIALVAYSSHGAPHNEERAPLGATDEPWKFTREIEPSLVLFGIIFALSFFFLLGRDPLWLLLGIGGIALGALALIAADLSKHVFRITSVQRIVTIITVAACLLMPLDNEVLRIGLSIIVTASCSFLVIANSIFLIRKICIPRSVPVFRAIPKRLLILSGGFALGWLIATIIIAVPGGDPEILKYVRLGAAILLVAIVMIFLPVEGHHEDTATAAGGHRAYDESDSHADENTVGSTTSPGISSSPALNAMIEADIEVSDASTTPPPIAISPGMSESEVFDAKCTNIAKLYQLSPREAEILPYLARGRNNAYLQDKFVISPHTAKSHIYNIYRKLDIHSQQKLMDFVEEFPDDYDIN